MSFCSRIPERFPCVQIPSNDLGAPIHAKDVCLEVASIVRCCFRTQIGSPDGSSSAGDGDGLELFSSVLLEFSKLDVGWDKNKTPPDSRTFARACLLARSWKIDDFQVDDELWNFRPEVDEDEYITSLYQSLNDAQL